MKPFAAALVLVAASGTPALAQGAGIATRAVLDPGDEIAFHALTLPDTVWVGQQATYQVGVFLSDEIRARLRRNPVFVPPELRSMLSYDLAAAASVARTVGPRHYEVHVFQRALFPLTAGRHEIPPSRLEYALPLSNSFFAREESHSSRTEGLVVVARDPPAAGRPADFKGAVGRLSLQSSFDRPDLRTGNPFTFTLTVLGVGNVSLLPRPDFLVPWADVVPGAVRVQMDSTTTLVRGRKEFDWIVTPVQPGRQELPAARYPYFNPYTEQYEVAVTRPARVVVTGEPVVVDRATADSMPVLTIRRVYEGQVPAPITDSALFWALLVVAPLPFVGSLFVGRPGRVRLATPPEQQLRDATVAGGADAALVRRIFAGRIADRIQLAPSDMADRARFTRALRRAGVSEDTAREAERLLTALDSAVYAGGGEPVRNAGERAANLLRAIDGEARSRAALVVRARQAAGTLAVLLMIPVVSASAPGASQSGRDLVASTVFGNGLAAYDAREFGSARQAFHELTQARPRSADAWFNFATASWQLQDTAAAVVGWQRALRLQPTAKDTRLRLRLAPGRPRLWFGVPPVGMNTIGMAGALAWIAACALFFLGRRRPSESRRRGGLGLAVMAVVALVAGLRQHEILSGRNVAVVLAPTHLRELPVLSSDAGVEAQPGEVVRIVARQGAWTRIELSDRRVGWVEERRLEEVAPPARPSGESL